MICSSSAGILDAGGQRGVGEIFLPADVRIAVRFQHEHAAVRPHAKIHARVAAQVQRAEDAFG